MSEAKGAITVFISYDQVDQKLRDQLIKHLSVLQHQRLISWYDRKITPGEDWRNEIDAHLDSAQIILLLVSSNFIASDYCYGSEMRQALKRHEEGDAIVIPIILRPVDWSQAPFGKLQVLPRDGKPMTSWKNRDEAFVNVTRDIRNAIAEIVKRTSMPADRVLADSSVEPAIPSVWNVPYPRNVFFTGREDILKVLYDTFLRSKTDTLSSPLALVGLGGIGKTQTAVEYAYRYSRNYQVVLFAQATSHAIITNSFLTIAQLLDLPLRDAQDQSTTVSAVRSWLEMHTDWLLILDDADDLAVTFDFLPSNIKGHILLTTRNRITGTFTHVEVSKMSLKEGTLFLLRRGRIIRLDARIDTVSATELATAEHIVQVLDGLPLALDQAGAFIEETECSVSDYLQLYQVHSAKLLRMRGSLDSTHPEAIPFTWASAFHRLEKTNPAAADLLRFFVFLSPDDIPEEIIINGASELGPLIEPFAVDSYALDLAIEALHRYSLVRFDPKAKTVTIHRLVQVVLRDEMDKRQQYQWAERAVRTISKIFPIADPPTWSLCQRYLPHALICTSLIDQWNMTFPEAVQLLNHVGDYLKQRAQYEEAEPLYQRASLICEQQLGSEHPTTADSLNNLANLYHHQGKYNEAEALYQRVLSIRKHQLGAEHPSTATSLNNLAVLYSYQGRYIEAEQIFVEASVIDQKIWGLDHPNVARDLNNLGEVLEAQGRLSEALVCYERALQIDEKIYGSNHPNIAVDVNNLGSVSRLLGNLSDAQRLYEQALSIDEKAYGPNHPNVAIRLNNLGRIVLEQGKPTEAKMLYERALQILQTIYGSNHPNVGNIANNLGNVYQEVGDLTNAEAYYKQAYTIFLNTLGEDHPYVAQTRENLSSIGGASK
jgi:tetratricopeptide (TPR) repeat protein